MMVTTNQLYVSTSNRPSSGCAVKEKGWGLYNIQFDFYLMTRIEVTLYIVQPSAFSLTVQPDDRLLEVETCSWLAVIIIRCIYIYIQCDSFGIRPKKMRISQSLFIKFWTCIPVQCIWLHSLLHEKHVDTRADAGNVYHHCPYMHVQNLMNSLSNIRVFLDLVPKQSHCV
jgi:hypothetical protein